MAFDVINIGTSPNDGTGDNLRVAMGKAKANFATLEASGGSAAVGFLQAGTSASARTAQAKMREIEVSITDFGAVDGGDIYTAFGLAVAALTGGGTIKIPRPDTFYTLSAPIATGDSVPIRIVGEGAGTRIKKTFNGDMLSLGKQCELIDVYLDGQGGTYTGRGVICTTGGIDGTSWRRISGCKILDTASYGVEFTAANAGYSSWVEDCWIIPTGSTTTAIKQPAAAENGNRTYRGINSGGTNPLIDLGGANNTAMTQSQGAAPVFSTLTQQARLIGNDFTGSTLAIKGSGNMIIGNRISATSITFDAACADVTYFGNHESGGPTFTDSAQGITSNNRIEITDTLFTPSWTGTGTPAIGNGTLNGFYRRDGDYCDVSIQLVPGSTTTYGTAAWFFSLPYIPATVATGTVLIQDVSTGTNYVGTFVVLANDARGLIYLNNSTANAKFDQPMAWATGDALYAQVRFRIK